MAIQLKPVEQISAKWAKRAQAAAPEYELGVRNPKKDWAARTADAEDAYDAGVQEGISQNRFSKGVRAAGNARWQDQSTTLGKDRYGPGVSKGLAAHQSGFAPYHQILSALSLGDRGPRGSAQNFALVKQVGDALHARRVGS